MARLSPKNKDDDVCMFVPISPHLVPLDSNNNDLSPTSLKSQKLEHSRKADLTLKLQQRQHPDILVAKNILRTSPSTSPRVAASQQELRWQQTSDTLGALFRKGKPPPLDESWLKVHRGEDEGDGKVSFSAKVNAVRTGLMLRSPRGELIRRGVLQTDEDVSEDLEESLSPSRQLLPSLSPHPPRSRSPSPRPSQQLLSPIMPFSPSQSPPPPKRKNPPKVPLLNIHKVQLNSPPIKSAFEPPPSTYSSPTPDFLLHTLASPHPPKNGKLVKRLEGEAGIPTMCRVGDNVWIGYRSGVVMVRSAEGYDEIEAMRRRTPSVWVLVCAGTQVWAGYNTGDVDVWDGDSGELVKRITGKHTSGITSMCYIPSHLQAINSDPTDSVVTIWNATDMTCVYSASYHHTGSVRAITLCSNRVWSVADDALIWEIPLNQAQIPLNQTQIPPTRIYIGEGVLSLLYVPSPPDLSSGSALPAVWAGMADGTIKILDSNTTPPQGIKILDTNTIPPQVIKILEGHAGYVNSLLLAGTHVWSASSDKAIRIWNTKTLECIAQLTGHGAGVYTLLLAGSHVWSAASDRSVRVWLSSGVREMVADVITNTRAASSELDNKVRRQEERLVQADAEAKRLQEEVDKLKHKVKQQTGETLKLRHEVELLASEASAVEDWKNKAKRLQAVYSSELAALQEELVRLEDCVEIKEAEAKGLVAQLSEQEAMVMRIRGERLRAEESASRTEAEFRRSRDWASHEIEEWRAVAERTKSELVESRSSWIQKDKDLLESFETLKAENALLHQLLKSNKESTAQPPPPHSKLPRRNTNTSPPLPSLQRRNTICATPQPKVFAGEVSNNDETHVLSQLLVKLGTQHKKREALHLKTELLYNEINEIKKMAKVDSRRSAKYSPGLLCVNVISILLCIVPLFVIFIFNAGVSPGTLGSIS